jgi:hypothetical protein
MEKAKQDPTSMTHAKNITLTNTKEAATLKSALHVRYSSQYLCDKV